MKATHNLIHKPNRNLCGAGVLAVLLSASVAHAAVSVTGNSFGAAAPTLNSSFGTLEFALNIGGVPLTRDGITFTTAGANAGNVRTFLSNGGLNSTIDVVGTISAGGGTWETTDVGATPGLDTLYYTVAYAGNNGSHTIDFTDLDPSKSYQFQFLFGDPRNGSFPYDRSLTLSDSSGSSAPAPISIGKSGLGDEFGVVTAVVSGSTNFKYFAPVTANQVGGPIISGLVVHSVPEPSAALLGGLGLLGLLTRRRRA